MKKKAGLTFILLSIIFALQGEKIFTSLVYANYFPLITGNLWVYEYYSPIPPPNGTRYKFKSVVTHDSLINVHKYYFITNTKYISYFDTLNWFRVDSTGTCEVEWDGSAFASGVYFYSLAAEEFTQTRKLILLK